MHSKYLGSTLAMLLLTGACGDDEITTEGPGSTTDATVDTTGGEPSTTDATPTTDDSTTDAVSTSGEPTGTTTTEATTTETTTTEATTTVEPEPETTTDTTGGVDPGIVSACQDYCDRWGECGFLPDPEGCVMGCSESFPGASGECKAANHAALVCATGLSCEELLASIEGNPDGPCAEQTAAVEDACSEGICSSSWGGSDTECEMSRECEGAPVKKMLCDEQTCTCFEDEQKIGECPSENICAGDEAIFDKATSCCGF